MQDQSAELARLPQIDQQGSIGGARVLADHRRRCIAASAAVAGRGPVVASAQERIGDMYRRPAVNREARRG